MKETLLTDVFERSENFEVYFELRSKLPNRSVKRRESPDIGNIAVMATQPEDGPMNDFTFKAGASGAGLARDSSTPTGSALTVQSVREFLADCREVTRYVLISLIDENLIEFLRIGNRLFISAAACERMKSERIG